MEKKYSRILKKNNNSDYILEGLIKKDIKQFGGNDTVTLKNTQIGLLKALKNLPEIKPSLNTSTINDSNIRKILIDIETKIKSINNDKSGPNDYSTFTNNLNKFDKFLNDISGGEIKLQYSNDYKMNPLLQVNIKSLEEINTLFKEITDFKERDDKVEIDNLTKLNPDQTDIKFKERNHKVNLDNLNQLNPKETEIQFDARYNKVGIDLDKLQLPKTPVFEERHNPININLDQLNLPKEPTFNERENKVVVNEKLLKPKIVDLNFNERNNIVNSSKIDELDPSKLIEGINLSTSYYSSKMNERVDFITSHMKPDEGIKKLKNQIDILKKLNNLLKKGIQYYSEDIISEDKIKEYASNVKFIETENNDKDTISGFNEVIQFKESMAIDKEVIFRDKGIKMVDNDEYFSEVFIDKIYMVGGGLMDEYLNKTSEYSKLLKDRNIVNEFKETVNEYNIVYLQSYYYKLFILKNINKFSGSQEHTIYQFINKDNLIKYQQILFQIDKYISDPENEIFNNINSRAATVNSIFYFRYFIIVKNLLSFFNNILIRWNIEKIPDSYKIDIFNEENPSTLPKKEVVKYFLLFNLIYKILDKYKEHIKN